MAGTWTCGYAAEGSRCGAPAEWAVVVGESDVHPACAAHRNAVLMAFEPKDVSGIVPIAALDEPEG